MPPKKKHKFGAQFASKRYQCSHCQTPFNRKLQLTRHLEKSLCTRPHTAATHYPPRQADKDPHIRTSTSTPRFSLDMDDQYEPNQCSQRHIPNTSFKTSVVPMTTHPPGKDPLQDGHHTTSSCITELDLGSFDEELDSSDMDMIIPDKSRAHIHVDIDVKSSEVQPPPSPRGAPPPAIATLSTLYTDYKYPTDLKTDSLWFPFDSKSDAIIYLWDAPGTSNRLPQQQLTSLLQALPLIGVKGLSCSTGQVFRNKYDARIPLMKQHHVHALKSIRHHQKTKKDSPNDEHKMHKVSVSVPFFSPDEHVIRTMADPLWSHSLRFGLDKVSSDTPITQFNQTPYATELLRWARLCSIDRMQDDGTNDPLMIGHWYASKDHTDKYALILGFRYLEGKINRADEDSSDWWPRLYADVRLCPVKPPRRGASLPLQRVGFLSEQKAIQVDRLGVRQSIFRGTPIEYKSLNAHQRRQYTARLSTLWEPSDIPDEPKFQYPEVLRGEYFFFLSWFVDSFKATKSSKQSVDGVYQSIMNIDGRFRNTGEVNKTLTLIEAGVDIGQVLRAITASSKLRAGFTSYLSTLDDTTNVKGTLAMTPADLVQLSAQCRHGGSNSDHNCPNCTVVKKDRTTTTLKITNPEVTRTRQLTDRIVQLCQKWIQSEAASLGKAVPKTVIEDIHREFAVSLQPSWFEGWEFDEHRQGFREAEHLFYYGIFREQLSWLTGQMSTTVQTLFIARIDSFKWPDGMPALSFDFNPKRKNRWGTDVSMAMYKQLFVATLFALDRLIPDNQYKHFVELWLWHIQILDTHISVDDVPALQTRGLNIIEQGVKIMPTVYDRPNGHGVIELILRTLPALVYIRLVAAGNLERHHQLAKRTNPSRWFIQDAMKSFNVIDTLRLLLHGTRWGPTREFILGSGLRNLADPKNPSKPHRLILNITSVLNRPIPISHPADTYWYHEGWAPLAYEYLPNSGHPSHTPPPANIRGIIIRECQRLHTDDEVYPSACSWYYPSRLRKQFSDGSSRTIRVGNTVMCNWDTEGEHFAKVHRFIELRHKTTKAPTGRRRTIRRLGSAPIQPINQYTSDEWRIVFVQVQWYSTITEAASRQIHPIRRTQIRLLSPDISPSIFTCGHIIRQVLAIHMCHFEPSVSTTKENKHCCPMYGQRIPCKVIALCHVHSLPNCTRYTCADKNKWSHRIQHDLTHNHFEIADEQHGLHFDSPKELKYVNLQTYKGDD